MKKLVVLFIWIFFMIYANVFASDEDGLRTFIDKHVKLIKPLEKQLSLAYWDATQYGKSEDYERYADLSLALSLIYSNKDDFRTLKNFKKRNKIGDKLLKRQLEILYNSYLGNQIDQTLLEEITKKSAEVEEKFNTFIYYIDGKEISNNEINNILKEEKNSILLEKAWKAQKIIGKEVASDLVELVKLRNKAADSLGFRNYYEMSLSLSEQNTKEIIDIFDNLYNLSNEPFRQIKNEIDSVLGKRYDVPTQNLMPWHYQNPFFQAAPEIYTCNREKYIENEDVVDIAKYFYNSIDMDVSDILARSEPLSPAQGKNPHAYTINIDSRGDIRVFLNLENNIYWLETAMHELGHAVYYKYIDYDSLPYILRGVPHIFCTEAIAMFFERLPKKAQWWHDVMGISEEEKENIDDCLKGTSKYNQLVFARWDMVMTEFERSMYENPDQDLNRLWWQLKSKYQYLSIPENWNNPDWAAKIHFTSSPCYYHNYLLGELLASQFNSYAVKNVVNMKNNEDVSYYDEMAFGSYLKEKVFSVGNIFKWDEMIRRSTGEDLNAKYFIDQFIK